MTYKGDGRGIKVVLLITVLLVVFGGFKLSPNTVSALTQKPVVVLAYENLYGYGENDSEVFDLYQILRSNDCDVLLLPVSQYDKVEIPQNATIVIVRPSFENNAGYLGIYQKYSDRDIIFYDGDLSVLPLSSNPKKVMICIDNVYPFSDLNHLMDTAEVLNEKGIEFICTVMPVYDNADLPAFDQFIEVLSYVKSKGGKLFIHYPVYNADGTYSLDPKEAFLEAVELYRDRGLAINGITLSFDQLFSGDFLFEGLDLPFVLVNPPKNKLDTESDYYEISADINQYVYLSGTNIDDFDIFTFDDQQYFPKHQVIDTNLLDEEDELTDLINLLNSHTINVMDFSVSDYDDLYKEYDFTVSKQRDSNDAEKSQLDSFKEKELEKIMGTNLGDEEEIRNFDISDLFHSVIAIILIILLLLGIQLFVGRRLDLKKIFKK